MKFLASVSALAALVASVVAQTEGFDPVFTPEENQKVTAGETFEITWKAPDAYIDGTVSLHLIGGATQKTQVPLADIAAGIPNSANKYSWTVDASLGAEKVYGLVIKLESNPAVFQYSMPFQITKAGGEKEGEKKAGSKHTTIVTKDYGVKTVTLSSCPPTTTSSSSTPPPVIVTPTSTPIYTPPALNTTTTIRKPTKKPAPTTIVQEEPEQPTTPAAEVPTKPATVPDSAGARSGASIVALVGALAVAAFAL